MSAPEQSLLEEFTDLLTVRALHPDEYEAALTAFRARLAEVDAAPRRVCLGGFWRDAAGNCSECGHPHDAAAFYDDGAPAYAAPSPAVSAEALVGGLSDDSISRIMLVANDVERLSHRGGPMTANSPYIAFRVELQRALEGTAVRLAAAPVVPEEVADDHDWRNVSVCEARCTRCGTTLQAYHAHRDGLRCPRSLLRNERAGA